MICTLFYSSQLYLLMTDSPVQIQASERVSEGDAHNNKQIVKKLGVENCKSGNLNSYL